MRKIVYIISVIIEKVKLILLSFSSSSLYTKSDLEDQKNVLFVLSCGRSGSTLLRKELLKRGVAIPPESHGFIPAFLSWVAINQLKSWNVKVEKAIELFNNNAPVDYWCLEYSNIRESLLRLKHCERSIYKIVKVIYFDFINRNYGMSSMWGDKTPLLSQYLAHVRLLFPNAKYIFITRASDKVISSWRSNFGYSSELAKKRYLWTNKEVLLHSRKVPSFPILTLENFTRYPIELLDRVFLYLGVCSDIIDPSPFLGDDNTEYHKGLKDSIKPHDKPSWLNGSLDSMHKEVYKEELRFLGKDDC